MLRAVPRAADHRVRQRDPAFTNELKLFTMHPITLVIVTHEVVELILAGE